MNELQRFKSVIHFEKPDYWPLPLTIGRCSISDEGRRNLQRQGMPEWVNNKESWCRYWGQCYFDVAEAEAIGAGGVPMKLEKWTEGDFKYTRNPETGLLMREFKDTEYSMPEFIEFDVRDRESFERFKKFRPQHICADKLEEQRNKFSNRTRPLMVRAGGTWGGWVRGLMGPERALYAIYDDPDLVYEMINFRLSELEKITFPLIEALKPEIIEIFEDFCYNHGMLISPEAFRKFCAPYYRKVANIAHDCGGELLIVDCDGKVDQFIQLLDEVGFNGIWPLEQVCGNPILEYRRHYPKFIFSGGIEKEIANSGNGDRIKAELSRMPSILKAGGYLPSFDHSLQVSVGFDELCKTMTWLHKICGSETLGEFPRRY